MNAALAALADWIEEQLGDELASRQAIAETALARIRALAEPPGSIEVIDQAIRDLHDLRAQIVSGLRADQDARAVRVDALLAECRARRDGAR